MSNKIDLLIAKEIEFCEGEMKRHMNQRYSSTVTIDNAAVYWRGRKEGAEEIRSKLREVENDK